MNNASPMSVEKKTVQQVLADQKKPPMLKAQSTKPIKLKDSLGRGGIKFNLIETFGFTPEELVIQKVNGRNNTIIISAVVPQRVLLQEEASAKRKAARAQKKKIST